MAKKTTFESSLERLEEIVQKLESGDIPLDEAIGAFEEGMTLANQCAKHLDDAERKLKKLVRNNQGFQLDLLEFEE